jgi:uncharacterized protein
VRVFPDTNVLVSSLGFEGVTRRLVKELAKKHEVIVSDQVIDEFKRVSLRIGLSKASIDEYLSDLLTFAIIVKPPFARRFDVRDPNDIDILAAAIKANADVLVTGDKDLLEVLHSPIRIMRPRELFDQLTAE